MSINPVEHDVLPAIKQRWSPYRYDARPVETEKLLACLEAARWAASSFNDQPWSWIVARREDSDAFDTMLGCLMEANQPWAASAGVLLLSVIRPTFRKNGKPNRVALHDLGQAAAHLALQAAALGLQAHQMAGVNLSRVRSQYQIPEDHQPETAIAIGYPDDSEPKDELGESLRQREAGPRTRIPLSEQVFSGRWGTTANFSDR
ncbi:nitroreductase family protein [Stieleria varia]|uniref:Malonic semialdehyde reductase n=1 Tax=Stieleria varia TaxID=2528005 RepID=A0A5C6A307_9BACT|nr:nitroreductase family protein [Stieleria varia]TWT93786.1 malonic semialdehyde reductase [Stieleria varia]